MAMRQADGSASGPSSVTPDIMPHSTPAGGRGRNRLKNNGNSPPGSSRCMCSVRWEGRSSPVSLTALSPIRSE